MYFITRNIFNLKIDILLKLGSFDDENVAKKEKNVGKNMRKMTKINQNLWAIAIFGIFVHIKSKSNKKRIHFNNVSTTKTYLEYLNGMW